MLRDAACDGAARTLSDMRWRLVWRDITRAIRWHRGLVLLIAVSAFIGAVVYLEGAPRLFEGRAMVAMTPRVGSGIESEDASGIRTPAYAARITSPEVLAEVARAAGVSSQDVEDGLDVSYDVDGALLTIVVLLPAPTDAAEVANLLAREVVEESENDPLLDAEIASRAFTPLDPAKPRRGRLSLAVLGFGLIMGASASALLERRRPRLRTWREIGSMTGLPVVGMIPELRTIRVKPRDVLSQPLGGAAFRGLRSAVLRSGRGSLLVVAARRGEGASTVAGGLAESLARVGERVLLIDADLRVPTIATRYRLDVERGLSAALRGTTRFERAVKRGWVEGLDVMTTKADRDAGDLLATHFPPILREAEAAYDWVIVDTPPLVDSSEAGTLASSITRALLVVRAGGSTDDVLASLLALDPLRATVQGVVANALPTLEDDELG